MNFKKTLTNLIATSALTIGAANLAILPGCEKVYELEKIAVSTNSPYPEFENQAYDFLNTFSNEIPKEFVQETTFNGSYYHDKSLVLKDDKKTIESGKGRFVFMFKSKEKITRENRDIMPENITIGYADKKEIDELLATKDVRAAKSNIMLKKYIDIEQESLYIIEDMFVIMKGNQAVFYIKESGYWKKGTVKIISSNKMLSVDYKKICKDPVPIQDVRRYIDLAERFNKTYFTK